MRTGVALLGGGKKVSGVVNLEQENESSPVVISGFINGLHPGQHGLHIHQYGDIINGCESVGRHFNPLKKTHGAPTDENRHMGDLGNVTADGGGTAKFKFTDSQVTLFGIYSVIGRTVVVHAYEDDLGKGGDEQSTITGHTGPGLAWGVIGIGLPDPVDARRAEASRELLSAPTSAT
ncbi:Superoxide dismutase [Cu-Zn] [Coemansia helicoidea]|uniref:Superoxide dismutase [Cu-Zn] n=1 Tax=Coemansia helicoidea TaxID=1286919 RepID=A0ACC1KU55_9FUNG|nr:Superoxide dismutase [Cu-Zn] [Coemansia helicoidea]